MISLEQTLNIKLIDRSQGQKSLSLTKRGEEFLNYAREFIFLTENVMAWSKQMPRERLRIGTIDSLTFPLFKRLYRNMANDPHILLEISHHWTDRIYELLEKHQLDAGIVPRLFNSANIVTYPMFSEKMVLVSYNHLKPVFHPSELDPALEVFFDWGTPFVTWHDSWFEKSKRPKMIVDITEALFEGLKIEGCWAIVPMSIAKEYSKRMIFSISHLEESPPDRIAYFVYRSNLHIEKMQLVQKLNREIREFVLQQPFLTIL